jgi:large subunit ribosomal protein L5
MAKPDKPQAASAPATPGGGKGGPPGGKPGAPGAKGPAGGKGQPAGKGQAAAKAKAEEQAPPARARSTGTVPPRLRERFRTAIVPALMKERNYGNALEVPRLTKIVVNMGLGEARDNIKVLDHAVADLQAITGQKPVVTKAKKSIANFKLRSGMPIGAKVTLRGARMYEFLDRLVNVALPRVRDFKGLSPKSFDGRGNYALGLREQVIFPEIVYDKIDKIRGMDVIVCTTARSDEEAKALLVHLGVPFRG